MIKSLKFLTAVSSILFLTMGGMASQQGMEETSLSSPSGVNMTQPTGDIMKDREDHFFERLSVLLKPERIATLRQEETVFKKLTLDYAKNPFMTLLGFEIENDDYEDNLYNQLVQIISRFECIAKSNSVPDVAFLNHVEEWETFVDPQIAQHYLKAAVQQEIEQLEGSVSADNMQYTQHLCESFILFSRSTLEFYKSKDLSTLGLSTELAMLMPKEVADLHKALSGLFLKPLNLEAALINLESDVRQETLSLVGAWNLNFWMVRRTLQKLQTGERLVPLAVLSNIQKSEENIVSEVKWAAKYVRSEDLKILSKMTHVSIDWYLRARAATYWPCGPYDKMAAQCLYVITEESCFNTLSVKLGGYEKLLQSLFDSSSGTLGFRTVVRLATEYFESWSF